MSKTDNSCNRFRIGDICRIIKTAKDVATQVVNPLPEEYKGHVVRVVNEMFNKEENVAGNIVYDYTSDEFHIVLDNMLEICSPEMQEEYRYKKPRM